MLSSFQLGSNQVLDKFNLRISIEINIFYYKALILLYTDLNTANTLSEKHFYLIARIFKHSVFKYPFCTAIPAFGSEIQILNGIYYKGQCEVRKKLTKCQRPQSHALPQCVAW